MNVQVLHSFFTGVSGDSSKPKLSSVYFPKKSPPEKHMIRRLSENGTQKVVPTHRCQLC